MVMEEGIYQYFINVVNKSNMLLYKLVYITTDRAPAITVKNNGILLYVIIKMIFSPFGDW